MTEDGLALSPRVSLPETGHRVQWLRYAEWLLTCPVRTERLWRRRLWHDSAPEVTVGLDVYDSC